MSPHSVWLIEYEDFERYCRPCWISNDVQNHAFGVTWNPLEARRFMSGEDARNEILRLGLAAGWVAVQHCLPN